MGLGLSSASDPMTKMQHLVPTQFVLQKILKKLKSGLKKNF